MKKFTEFLTESRPGLKGFKAGQVITVAADIDYDDVVDQVKVKGFGFNNNSKHAKVQWASLEDMMKDVPDELKSDVMNGKYHKFQEYLVKTKKSPAVMGSLSLIGDVKGKQVTLTDLGGAMGITYKKGDTQKQMGRTKKIS